MGEIFLKRSRNLSYGSWQSPPRSRSPMESGCINRTAGLGTNKLAPTQDCAPGSAVARIAPGFSTHYWANNTDRGRRAFLDNLTAWDWSVNDADLCDRNGEGPTYFMWGMCAQTHAKNWSGTVGGFYQIGMWNGTAADFLASYFQ